MTPETLVSNLDRTYAERAETARAMAGHAPGQGVDEVVKAIESL